MLSKYFPPYYQGGIETYVYDLVQQLEKWADIHVIASHVRNEGLYEAIPGSSKLTLLPRIAVSASMPICPAIFSVLKNIHADLIHIQSPNPFFEAALLKSKTRTPIIVTHHSDVIRQWWAKPLYYPMYRKFLDLTGRIIATSENYARHSDTIRSYMDKVRIVPLGISTDLCNNMLCGSTPFTLRPELLQQGYVLGVGRLVHYKGFEYLIRAAKYHSLHTVIVGKGPKKEKLLRVASKEGLNSRITFLEGVDKTELHRLYHHCRVFVLASVTKNEAYGLVQLEAMIHGRPVISCDIKGSGITSVNQDGESGIVVPPQDSKAIGLAIALLLDNASLREQLGRQARERVLRLFSNIKAVSQVWNVYQEMLR